MDIPVSVTISKTAFGVGFTLRDEGKPYESTAIVSRVARGSPAEASGLKAGDQIIAINQKPVKSMTFLEVSNFLRSGSDQSIELTLIHKAAQNHKEYNSAIMINELPDSNALILSSMANGVERISSKDTNIPSDCGTTDEGYGGGGVAVEERKVTSDSVSAVSATTAYKIADNDHQLDRPKPKPRNTNRKYRDYNDMENVVEALYNKSSMKPVLSQLQEPKPLEYNHSSTGPLLSNNLLPSEGRKENTIPPSSIQLIHNPSGKNDDVKHATTVKSTSCHHHNPSTTTTTNITNSTRTNKEGVRIIRKHTIDSSVLEETNTDTLRVRFIRKRAYASARHPGRYDQVNLLTSQNNITIHTSPTSPSYAPPHTTITTTINHSDMPSTIIPPPSSSSALLSNTINTSPCQLLPAVTTNQKTPIKNQNIEPKITHLPRRRSSGGQSLRSHIPQTYDANPNLETPPTRIAPADVRRLNISLSSSSPKEDSDFHGKSMHSAVTHGAAVATATTGKPSLITSRLWSSSFEQDQNESVSELWTRAGEVYHLLELESQRLASKQAAAAKAAEAALSATPTTAINNMRRYPGAASHPMTGSSSYTMEKSVPGGSEFSTTQHLPFYSSPVVLGGSGANNAKDGLATKTNNYSSSESNRDHASVNPTAKRLQFRALCAGLRCHRSESNILCDMSGSFLSRQCFCKILAISGSDSKSYAWKPYYMCVADGEVKFIKASWAFYGAGRNSSKTSKNTNDIIYPRNASLNNLRDYSSKTHHNTSRSQDGLNDDSISYHQCPPSTSETDCSSISSSNIAGKSISPSSASCIVLPILGLFWRAEALPANFPNWLPLGSNSNLLSTPSSSRPSSTVINPDWMDPHFSGLSHPPPQQQTTIENPDSANIPMTTVTTTTTTTSADSHYNNNANNNNNGSTNEEDIRSKFRCYRFGHIAAGVELLFVFPDENAAMTCLKMCQLSGGRSYDVSKRSERYDHHHHHNASYPKKSVNPYELVFLKFPAFKAFSEIPVKSNYHSFNFSMKPTTTTTLNRHPVPLAGNEDDVDVDDNENNISNMNNNNNNNNNNKQKNNNHDFGDDDDDDDDDSAHNRNVFLQPVVVVSSSLMSSPFVTAVGPYCLPKDKRHRRYILNHLPADQELITGRNTESIFAKNNSVKFNTKYEDEKRKFWTRGRDKSAYYDGTRSDTSEATTTTTTDPSIYSHSVSSQISELSLNSNNNSNNTGDEKSHSSNNLIRSNKILRGFKQWLNRPVGGGLNSTVNSNNVSANHTTTTNHTTTNTNNSINSAIHSSCNTIASGIVHTFNNSNHNVNGTTNYNPSEISSTDPLQFSDSPNNEYKLTSLTAGVDPPNLTDMDNPGPIFGAPLESQLESPDYPCVPLLLQAIVIALEIHGLNLPGLYRKPGRHRTISQFISSINLHPDDVNFIFGLDAWREPNALCGLFKHFLRQLPMGLFCLSSWEPLACLISEASKSLDVQQLAYLLISMRVQLKKIALEAFGIPSMNTMPLDVSYYPTTTNTNAQTDDTVDCYPLHFNLFGLNSTNDAYKPSISPPISPHTAAAATSAATANMQSKDDSTFTFNNHVKMNKFKDFNVSKRPFNAWRWATLCYIMNHINRIVAHVQHNAVTYQCIAICFGPVFFGNSTKLPKLNEVLEHLFQHWNWLTDGLPMITKTTVEHIDCGGGGSTLSYVMNNDPTLSDAVTYLTNDNNKCDPYKKSFSGEGVHHLRGQQQQQDTRNPNDCYHQSRSRESSTHLQAPSSNQNHEQISSELYSNTEKVVDGDGDDEDELNREVIKQVKSLWLTALDKVSQANKSSAPKEKAYKYSEVNKSNGLHRTASAIPKTPIGNTGGRKGGGVRRLTVGTASPHPSTFDYYCISPPNFLYTKNNGDRKASTPQTIASSSSTNTTTATTTTAVKAGGGGGGVIIRRPVVPPVSATQSTVPSTTTTTNIF